MKLFYTGLLYLLIGGFSPAQAAAETTDEGEPFRVVIGFKSPVLDYCRAIVTEAFSRLGREVTVRSLPAERSILMANAGFADADCTRIKNIAKFYPNLVQVPEKIFDVNFVAFTRGDVQLDPGWEGLKPYNVGVVYGWKLLEKKISEIKPKSFIRLTSEESMFRMLELGRIDVATLSALNGIAKLRELNLNRIRVEDPPLASLPLYFTMHKRHAGLIEPLARIFREMKADGTWQRIEQQELSGRDG